MPLTEFQHELLAELSSWRTEELGYLAGGAALNFSPNSERYSNDLDFFHDSVERVAAAFAADTEQLQSAGYTVEVTLSQPGFIRCVVSKGSDSTRVDWAHDSAWRFMPLVRVAGGGLVLHPVDLAINKLLALVGRNEPRDFVDILHVHSNVLPLGAVCWAAAGKDPGFSPLSLVELLKRRGQYRAEDFARLDLVTPLDLPATKQLWRTALEEAEQFVNRQPADQVGCLYWSSDARTFVMPSGPGHESPVESPHYGRPGGVLPEIDDPRNAELS